MNAKDFEHTIKGNISLYQAIARRPKSFLNRNLTQALQIHQSDLETIVRASQRKSDSEEETSMTTACEHQNSQSPEWSLSLADREFQKLTRSEAPKLRVRRLQIRRLGTKRQQAKPYNESPDWLPGPNVRIRQSCTITFRIVCGDRKVLAVPQAAILEGYGSKNEYFFDIRLTKPFVLELEKLEIERDGIVSEGTTRSLAKDYFYLETTIQCNDPENARKFVGMVDPSVTPDLLENLSLQETRLVSRCGIKKLQPDGELLPLKRKPDGAPKRSLEYGLDAEIGWRRPPTGSLLARHNARQIREKQSLQPAQLPTPELSVSELPGIPHQSVRIKWILKRNLHALVHHTSGWRCAICQGADSPPHSSLTYLRLHLALHHDYLNFTPEYSPSEPGQIVIHINETDKTYASVSGPPEEGVEEYYVRPQRPFDQSRYLENKDKWTGHQVSRSQAARLGHKRGKKPKEPKDFVGRPAPVPAPKRPDSPSEVLDLPEIPRKRHRVPSVPNVKFFRKSSTRVVRGGEMLSDSDEDIDSTWASQYRKRDMELVDLPQPEVELVELLNRSFERESANGELFLMQVLVRFTREHRSLLKKYEVRREFKKRLGFFCKHQLIDAETVQRCIGLIDQDDGQPPSTPTRNGRAGEPQSAARDRSNWVPGAGFTESMTGASEQGNEAHRIPEDWHPIQIHREIILAQSKGESLGLESWLSIDQRKRSTNCRLWFRELDSFWDTHLGIVSDSVGNLTWKDPYGDFSLEVPTRQIDLQQFYQLLYTADRTLSSRDDDITFILSDIPKDSRIAEITKLRSSHNLLDRRNFQPGCAFHGNEPKAQRKQGEHYQPNHHTTARMIVAACPYCRYPVNTARKAIACENYHCPNGTYFHLACVELDRRPAGPWFCKTCTATRERNATFPLKSDIHKNPPFSLS